MNFELYYEAYLDYEAEKNGVSFFLKKKNKGGEKKGWLKKAGDKIKGFVRNVGQFGVLLPFKKLLANALDKKGVSHDNTIEDISVKFYNTFLSKKNNYEAEHLDPVLVSTIIGAILSFIRAAKEKKKQGGELSDVEKTIVDGADKVIGTVVGAARDEAKFKVGEFVFSPIGIGLIVLILFFFLKRK